MIGPDAGTMRLAVTPPAEEVLAPLSHGDKVGIIDAGREYPELVHVGPIRLQRNSEVRSQNYPHLFRQNGNVIQLAVHLNMRSKVDHGSLGFLTELGQEKGRHGRGEFVWLTPEGQFLPDLHS